MSEFFEDLVALITGQYKKDQEDKEEQQDRDEDNKGLEQ